MSSDVIGQLVTPQNSEIMPTAVHSDGSKPVRLPNRHPKVAPMKKDGTISPPLKPAPRVSAVKMIFSRNASGLTEPSILSHSHVYVGCLCPGPVDTEFNDVANVRFALKGISAEYCANYAIDRMMKHKTVIVPTLRMKLATTCGRFLPQSLYIKIVSHQQKKKWHID